MNILDEAENEMKAVLDKHGLQTAASITFPSYAILPDEVQLALKILAKHGMRIRVVLEEKKAVAKK